MKTVIGIQSVKDSFCDQIKKVKEYVNKNNITDYIIVDCDDDIVTKMRYYTEVEVGIPHVCVSSIDQVTDLISVWKGNYILSVIHYCGFGLSDYIAGCIPNSKLIKM